MNRPKCSHRHPVYCLKIILCLILICLLTIISATTTGSSSRVVTSYVPNIFDQGSGIEVDDKTDERQFLLLPEDIAAQVASMLDDDVDEEDRLTANSSTYYHHQEPIHINNSHTEERTPYFTLSPESVSLIRQPRIRKRVNQSSTELQVIRDDHRHPNVTLQLFDSNQSNQVVKESPHQTWNGDLQTSETSIAEMRREEEVEELKEARQLIMLIKQRLEKKRKKRGTTKKTGQLTGIRGLKKSHNATITGGRKQGRRLSKQGKKKQKRLRKTNRRNRQDQKGSESNPVGIRRRRGTTSTSASIIEPDLLLDGLQDSFAPVYNPSVGDDTDDSFNIMNHHPLVQSFPDYFSYLLIPDANPPLVPPPAPVEQQPHYPLYPPTDPVPQYHVPPLPPPPAYYHYPPQHYHHNHPQSIQNPHPHYRPRRPSHHQQRRPPRYQPRPPPQPAASQPETTSILPSFSLIPSLRLGLRLAMRHHLQQSALVASPTSRSIDSQHPPYGNQFYNNERQHQSAPYDYKSFNPLPRKLGSKVADRFYASHIVQDLNLNAAPFHMLDVKYPSSGAVLCLGNHLSVIDSLDKPNLSWTDRISRDHYHYPYQRPQQLFTVLMIDPDLPFMQGQYVHWLRINVPAPVSAGHSSDKHWMQDDDDSEDNDDESKKHVAAGKTIVSYINPLPLIPSLGSIASPNHRYIFLILGQNKGPLDPVVVSDFVSKHSSPKHTFQVKEFIKTFGLDSKPVAGNFFYGRMYVKTKVIC